MNRTTNQSKETLDNGWSVQIYSRDRRLLCSLYPSHGWALLIGMMLGLILALVGSSSQVHPSSPPSVSTPADAPLDLD